MSVNYYKENMNDIFLYMQNRGIIKDSDISESRLEMMNEVLRMEKVEMPEIGVRIKRGKVCYYMNMPSKYSLTGERHQVTGSTKEEVEKRFQKEAYSVITKMLEKEYRENVTVQEVIYLSIKNRHIKESSKSKYYKIYYHHIKDSAFGKLKACNVKYFHVEDFFNELYDHDLVYTTMIQMKSIISKAFEYAIVRDIMIRNYARDLKINSGLCKESDRQTERIFTKEEIIQLEEASIRAWKKRKYKNSALVFCLLYTGMRIGELLALEKQYIDLQNGIIHIKRGREEYIDYEKQVKIRRNDRTKNRQSKRTIRLNDRAIFWFEEMIKRNEVMKIDSEYLAVTKKAEIITYNNLYASLQCFFKYAGVDYNATHICRKTNISIRLDNGDKLADVSKSVGHGKQSTTLDVYNKSTDNGDSIVVQNQIFNFGVYVS